MYVWYVYVCKSHFHCRHPWTVTFSDFNDGYNIDCYLMHDYTNDVEVLANFCKTIRVR